LQKAAHKLEVGGALIFWVSKERQRRRRRLTEGRERSACLHSKKRPKGGPHPILRPVYGRRSKLDELGTKSKATFLARVKIGEKKSTHILRVTCPIKKKSRIGVLSNSCHRSRFVSPKGSPSLGSHGRDKMEISLFPMFLMALVFKVLRTNELHAKTG